MNANQFSYESTDELIVNPLNVYKCDFYNVIFDSIIQSIETRFIKHKNLLSIVRTQYIFKLINHYITKIKVFIQRFYHLYQTYNTNNFAMGIQILFLSGIS